MRINKFVALASGMSRRAADRLVASGRIRIDGTVAGQGDDVPENSKVSLGDKPLSLPEQTITIMLNKPAGYVVSRDGQGSPTVYDLLPPEFRKLKPVGRLDKDSSGLLLLTNDGQLAHELTHPKFAKEKIYEIEIDKALTSADKAKIEKGIEIDNYISRLRLSKIENRELRIDNRSWQVAMSEGRNRQIRRTFAALDYKVIKLHRTQFGGYRLNSLSAGKYKKCRDTPLP